jgi:hypothetical protein
VANQRLSSPPARVGAVVPGRSYAEAVRSPPVGPTPPAAASPSSPSPPSVATGAASPPLAAGNWLAAMRLQFPKVFFQDAAASSMVPPHGVRHVIRTVGQPATAKFRRLDPTRLAAAKQEFQSMLDEGIIRRSSSQWSSPLHMVQKKDGSWRPCGDYRQLNLQTVEDKYPLPNMADLAARLDGCKLFSKLHLRKGYLQVPVAAEDVAKTAIITPFGLFEFTRMPFGLRNAGMTFQRLMDSVLGGLPFAFVYLDDILIASPDPVSHRRHLEAVFTVLQSNGLIVNADKCLFGCPEVDFLSHRLTAGGISPLPSRVQAIADFPQPAIVKHLQAFLGLFNFYRRFVPAAARIIQPLTRALRGGPKGSTPLVWSAAMADSFNGPGSPFLLRRCWSTPLLEGRFPWSQTHLLPTLAPPSSSVGQGRHGGPWGSSPPNLTRLRSITAPLTGSYWRWCWLSAIFATCWRDAILSSSRITNPWSALFTGGLTQSLPASSAISHSSPNSPPRSTTSQANRTSWQTPFPGLPPPSAALARRTTGRPG